MPGIVAHMSVAKMIKDELGIDDNDFIRGNLLPDIVPGDKMISHFRIQGKWYHVPDFDAYIEDYDITNALYLGYYTHLMLDYLFMEEFIPDVIKEKDVFKTGLMYKDYDNSNEILINKYGLDVEELLNILKYDDIEVDPRRLETNLRCLKIRGNDPTVLFTIDEFEKFLEEASNRISNHVRQIKGENSHEKILI